MKIPFLDLKSQYLSIKTEVDSAIQDVLDNTAYVLGKAVNEFENNFAAAHSVQHCCGVSSGTDANHMVLWALGIGPGDEVIIPANTFIATAWGATLCGAKPVFVDCHPQSYNLDPAKVEAAITKKTKAIVAVHLYGQPADMEPLKKIAERRNLFLIEDAAQSHLAEYNGIKVGKHSVAASFSFYPGKNLGAYGEAGAVVTDDDNLARKFKMLRDHGSEDKYYHMMYGHNYRMEGIQGAVLNVKLKHLEKWNSERRRVADTYKRLLSDIEQIILPVEMAYAKHVYHLFVVQIKNTNSNPVEKRDKLRNYLQENGIATGLHYPVPLHLQPCFRDLGYEKGNFPVAEQLAASGLSLPIFPELSDDSINYISDVFHTHFKKN